VCLCQRGGGGGGGGGTPIRLLFPIFLFYDFLFPSTRKKMEKGNKLGVAWPRPGDGSAVILSVEFSPAELGSRTGANVMGNRATGQHGLAAAQEARL
jgi:hypothetical protein